MDRDPRHIVTTYRTYILSCKKRWGSARSLIHYHGIIREYCEAKRKLVASSARS